VSGAGKRKALQPGGSPMLAERLHPELIPSLTETPSMVRRRKREPGVLIAAVRFLPMLADFRGVPKAYSPITHRRRGPQLRSPAYSAGT
jgi:hypothetical protein